MAFIIKSKFFSNLAHVKLSRFQSFINKHQTVMIKVFSVIYIKITFEIGTEIRSGNVEM